MTDFAATDRSFSVCTFRPAEVVTKIGSLKFETLHDVTLSA